MRKWRLWLAVDVAAVLIFAAALASYVHNLPPHIPLGSSHLGVFMPRIAGMLVVVGLVNLSFVLFGELAGDGSRSSKLFSMLFAVALLLAALFGFVILLILSFPQY